MSQPIPPHAVEPYDVPLFALDGSGKPVLPYAGTSGWSGSATSKERATRADRDGTTSARQAQTLMALAAAGPDGLTWLELSHAEGWHHGTASGVLSVLHKEGRIARLSVSRDRCRIYVLPEYVEDRSTESHGRKAKPCPNCGWEESA